MTLSLTSNFTLPQSDVRTVLFVDDEPNACKWFARLFANEFKILTAGNVAEAEQILRKNSGEIAVLVTDFRMPGRDGLALLRIAQADYRHVVRLLATAYAEKDVAVAAINHGRVHRILEKPFDQSLVREALHDALGTYRQQALERSLIEGRASAMRETLGFLAHELNTPLATVLGYMEALQERHQKPPEGAPAGVATITEKNPGDTLTILEAAARRTLYAMSLVATFVQSARDAYPGAGLPPPLRASHLVNALLAEYPFEGEERSWVTADVLADFLLPAQRDLLYLVLCTLTKNALQALRSSKALDHPKLQIVLFPRTQNAVSRDEIRFIDNGPGIALDILDRLTHEPVTTRAAHGGSGMGLLFCRRVVQSMGGLIEVASKPGQGTTVTLQFKSDANLEG